MVGRAGTFTNHYNREMHRCLVSVSTQPNTWTTRDMVKERDDVFDAVERTFIAARVTFGDSHIEYQWATGPQPAAVAEWYGRLMQQ